MASNCFDALNCGLNAQCRARQLQMPTTIHHHTPPYTTMHHPPHHQIPPYTSIHYHVVGCRSRMKLTAPPSTIPDTASYLALQTAGATRFFHYRKRVRIVFVGVMHARGGSSRSHACSGGVGVTIVIVQACSAAPCHLCRRHFCQKYTARMHNAVKYPLCPPVPTTLQI